MTQPLTDREIMLLGKLWRCNWVYDQRHGVTYWYCRECGATGYSPTAVVHAIGCVFHGLPRDVVTAISADWTPA